MKQQYWDFNVHINRKKTIRIKSYSFRNAAEKKAKSTKDKEKAPRLKFSVTSSLNCSCAAN